MARFDLYANGSNGCLLDIPTDLIFGLNSRLVAPLLAASSLPTPLPKLHPVFDIEGTRYVLATHLVGAVRKSALRRPVGDLMQHYHEIVTAIDMSVTGF